MGHTVADETSDEQGEQGEAPQLTPDEARRRTARRTVIAIFYSLVVLYTLGSAAQISVQVYAAGEPWPGDCRSGLRHLASSLFEAERVSNDGGDQGVEVTLQRFRAAIAPGWAVRTAVERVCRQTGDEAQVAAFDSLERLRYAVETSVRRQVHDLGPLHRQAQALLAGAPGEAPPVVPAAGH